jgi:hypothetical protein
MPLRTFAKTCLTLLGPALVGLMMASCSSSSDSGGNVTCTHASKCPADQLNVNTCNAAIADKTCGAKYQAYLNCAASNQKCDATGKTDMVALATSCMQPGLDYTACVLSALDAGLD